MSHHTNSDSRMKQIISDVLSIGLSHIQDIAMKLKDLNVSEDNIKDKSPEEVQRSVLLNNILTILNDALHPAHELAKELYPNAKEFIEMCQENHKKAIERKLLASTCHCYTCNTKNPV